MHWCFPGPFMHYNRICKTLNSHYLEQNLLSAPKLLTIVPLVWLNGHHWKDILNSRLILVLFIPWSMASIDSCQQDNLTKYYKRRAQWWGFFGYVYCIFLKCGKRGSSWCQIGSGFLKETVLMFCTNLHLSFYQSIPLYSNIMYYHYSYIIRPHGYWIDLKLGTKMFRLI